MLNKSNMRRLLSLSLAVAGFVLVGGHFSETAAQVRDPFATPEWKRQKNPKAPTTATPGATPGAVKPAKPGPPPVSAVAAPPIEARINYYKQQRELAAQNGLPIPKVTTVLTLDEMTVSGIFKTPRGYAAMVEATPIKLSYTIYPGERFFDGQLVAIEENRLVFRKVVKMSNNKFVTSVENKALRQYTVRQEVQGTAPTEPATTGRTESAAVTPQPQAQPQPATTVPAVPTVIVSPVDEMNRQPASKPEDSVKEKTKKGKKPTKVAKKS